MTSNHTITLSIKLFGAFRRYSADPVVLTVAKSAPVSEIKQALGDALCMLHPSFNESSLLDRSVLANDRHIYQPTDTIDESLTLAILPPVCGG